VTFFSSAGDIQDLVWSRKAALAHAELKNVTALQTRRVRAAPPPPSTPSSTQH